MKKLLSIIASLAMVFSTVSYVFAVENESQPGYTISRNVSFPESDAQYQVRFTYKTDQDLESVNLVGGFQFYSQEQVSQYQNGERIVAYNAYQYKDGMFPTGYDVMTSGQSIAYAMTEEYNGTWSVVIPVPAGEWFYSFDINDRTTTTRVKDPANMPLDNDGSDSGWSLLFVGNSDEALDGQEWIFPRTDGQVGETTYVNYTASTGTQQPLGIYLPYGYDSSKTYKTLYLSHGGGGNEVEWHEIGAADNIMDNLIAAGEVDPNTIVVTMDNSYFGWNYTRIKQNLMENIIPYMEENYSVSHDARDRAFAGLSAGGMTASSVYSTLAGEFGYFGIWSYNVTVDVPNVENFDYPTLMLGYGHFDFGRSTYPRFIASLEAAGADYEYFEINGAHDWGVWRNLFSKFVKDFYGKMKISQQILVDTPEEVYQPGVTVVEDEESSSGYTAHFVYDVNNDSRISVPEGTTITGVQVVGSFRLLSGDAPMSENSDHGLDAYQNGDFCANVHPRTRDTGSGIWGAEWTFDMTLNEETGNYELDIPMISGAHYYYYQISFDNRRSVTIDDPFNLSPCRENEANSNSDTGDITHSIVYGKWDPVKQSESPNLDYLTPYEGDNKGTLEYVEYEGLLADDQDLGIYLPANYDPDRAEPYRVIYLSHGAGGNETYWFSQPQATNAMDHLIAENPDQEAIVVGMDNTLFGWNYGRIADNVINYIIPYMEANYNVSTNPNDRAFAGFSMGAMTTTYMAFHHADSFGYFGIFSGCNIGNATFKDGFVYSSSGFNRDGAAHLEEVYANIEPSEDLLNSVVFTMAGDSDTALFANGFGYYGAYETIRDWCELAMPEENFVDGGLVHGSHDIYTWGQCVYTFAKDICWTKEDNPVVDADKTALEIAVEVAQNVSDEQLEKVVPVVANEFNAALVEAQEVLANNSASQAQVDNAFARLANAMQMLDFIKGDKTALQAFVNSVSDLDANLYTDITWNEFATALENANDVLVDENAMQDEVNEVYDAVVRAYLDLRLKPSKDLLNSLINRAQSLNAANYSMAAWQVVEDALLNAQATIANENATEEEVAAAVEAMESALAGLLVTNPENSVEADVANTVVKAGDTTASIKTGDSASLGYSLAGLAVASMVLVANKKRKAHK